MYRVAVIVPFHMDEEFLALRREQQAEHPLPDLALEYRTVKAGPRRFQSAYDMSLADVSVLEAGLSAAQEGFDGICIDTMSDSGVNALRSVLDIPVVGPGRVAFSTALTLGHRFSVLAMWPAWFPLYTKTLTDMGVSGRCASMRAVGVTPDNKALLGGKSDVVADLAELAARCVEEDGADVLVLGSTTMHQAHTTIAARVPVPVLNPGPLSYSYLRMMLTLGLTHSRKAFPSPDDPDLEMVHAMLETAARERS
jgi:allantoin racemase